MVTLKKSLWKKMQWLLAGPLPIDGLCNFVREYLGFQGVRLHTGRGCGERINAVVNLPKGRIACARNRSVRIWKGSDCEAVLEGHTDLVLCLAFCAASCAQLASGSSDFTVRLWGTRSVLKGHQGDVRSLAFLDSDRLASGSGDRTVRIWDVVHNTCLGVLSGHMAGVHSLVALPSGSLASGSADATVRMWDDHHVSVMRGHQAWVTVLAVLEDGTLASGGLDRTIRRWRDGSCINIIQTLQFGVVLALAGLPGNLIACGFDDVFVVLDAVGNIVLLKLNVNVSALSFCKGKLALGTKFGEIQMWE
jgi:WD40 repeat protein